MDTIEWRLGVFPVLPRGWWGIIGAGKVLTREKRGKEERKQGRVLEGICSWCFHAAKTKGNP